MFCLYWRQSSSFRIIGHTIGRNDWWENLLLVGTFEFIDQIVNNKECDGNYTDIKILSHKRDTQRAAFITSQKADGRKNDYTFF